MTKEDAALIKLRKEHRKWLEENSIHRPDATAIIKRYMEDRED